MLVIQAAGNAPDFNGRLELVLTGMQNGKPWAPLQPAAVRSLQVRQYRRIDGVVDLPPDAMVKAVTVRVMDGTTVRATQAITLDLE